MHKVKQVSLSLLSQGSGSRKVARKLKRSEINRGYSGAAIIRHILVLVRVPVYVVLGFPLLFFGHLCLELRVCVYLGCFS